MKWIDQRRALALLAGLLTAMPAAAYEQALTEHAIREAYFLGKRRDQRTFEFFARYVQRLAVPAQGPHVAEVEVRTPYQQAVLRAYRMLDGSAQQAQQQYRALPQTVVVRIVIYLTPSYRGRMPSIATAAGPVVFGSADFWRDFEYRVSQKLLLAPSHLSGSPIYSGDWLGGSNLVGAEVMMEFPVAQVESGPLRIEVLSPDGHRAATEFDLTRLR